MAEYIERAAAVKVVLRERKPTNSVAQNRMLSIIQRDLLTMRAADVAPVIHGHWIKRGGSWYCSYCDKGYRITCGSVAANNHHFCPNCGAMMDGGDSDVAD